MLGKNGVSPKLEGVPDSKDCGTLGSPCGFPVRGYHEPTERGYIFLICDSADTLCTSTHEACKP